jgi:transcription antitermination factor NusG
MHWHIALTQPGQDRIAAAALRGRSYEVYHPLLPSMVRHGRGRMRQVIKSMFPGYLFVIDQANQGWHWLRNTNGIRTGSCLLTINGRLASVDNSIVEEVRMEEQNQIVNSLKHKGITLPYNIGDIVRVGEGPFSGLLGRVSRLDDDGRVCLLMDILGRSTPVHFSHEDLTAA